MRPTDEQLRNILDAARASIDPGCVCDECLCHKQFAVMAEELLERRADDKDPGHTTRELADLAGKLFKPAPEVEDMEDETV